MRNRPQPESGGLRRHQLSISGHYPNTRRLRLLHHIRCVATARKGNHDIRSAFRQYARSAKRTPSPRAAKRSPFRSERLRRDAVCLRPFKGQRSDATSTTGNNRREDILSVKTIELRIKLGAIAVVTAGRRPEPSWRYRCRITRQLGAGAKRSISPTQAISPVNGRYGQPQN